MKFDLKSPPNLKHFLALHDKYGILQHTTLERPAYEFGYSIDDQARALIVVTQYLNLYRHFPEKGNPDPRFHEDDLVKKYIEYIQKVQQADGSYSNYISYDGEVSQRDKSEDSFGRVYWALGYYLANNTDPKLVEKCVSIIEKSNKYIGQIKYLRARAYLLVGLSYLVKVFPDKTFYKTKLIEIEESLLENFKSHSRESGNLDPRFHEDDQGKHEAGGVVNWKWFEDKLVYANALIPYSLLLSSKVTRNSKAHEIALISLDWLDQVCRVEGKPAPIGNLGWYPKGGIKASYDQQVIDSADMVLALTEAYKVTGNQEYLTKAQEWFGWFLGENSKGLSLLETESGAVFDGLHEDRVNLNRGAESVICYLLAYLSLAKTV